MIIPAAVRQDQPLRIPVDHLVHQIAQMIRFAPESGLDVPRHPSIRVTDMSQSEQGPDPAGHLLRLEVLDEVGQNQGPAWLVKEDHLPVPA